MEIACKKNKLGKQLSSASEIKRNFGVNARRVSSRIDEMHSSPSLAVLMQIPAANCHLLSGDRKGHWAVDISANFRIIFEPNHTPVAKKEDGSVDTTLVTKITILEIGDYH